MISLDNATVYLGSNLNILPTLPDNSVDSIVTDPPYELGFMGKKWDNSGIAYSVELWAECLRVLKPGGHLLAFSGSRTYHRMTVAIEDAGFEIRDMISWISNKTFPKSHNISKAIDKAAGVEREVIGQRFDGMSETAMKPDKGWNANSMGSVIDITAPATDEAKAWDGWGTALKPTVEPIVMARKPFDGTIADNVLQWGVGGLNIDASRISTTDSFGGGAKGASGFAANYDAEGWTAGSELGRWPANVAFDEDCAGLLDKQSGVTSSQVSNRGNINIGNMAGYGNNAKETKANSASVRGHNDSGGASRFFYVARASKQDRNEGIESNTHPTVKPTALMEYLIRLVTPAGGVVLDPFTGSGSTGKAALLNGYKFIGCELTPEYLPIIEGRLKHAAQQYAAQAIEKENKESETLF
jgi:DNA modification methylase